MRHPLMLELFAFWAAKVRSFYITHAGAYGIVCPIRLRLPYASEALGSFPPPSKR